MADIFISYANTDRERVIPVVKALEEQGWSVFWDWRSIPVGKTWRQFIEEGLDEARSVLVLWSEVSINSEWVIEEADYGKTKRILIPALIDDVRPPIGFRQIQAARLLGWRGEKNHAGFQLLKKALTGLLGPAPLQQKITNSIGMEFVLIPAGSFMMGSKLSPKETAQKYGGEAEWFENEQPQHKVTISKPFYLQTTVVTQGQWQKVMGNNPSRFKDGGDSCPVEQVSWEDAQDFIKKLNKMEGTDNQYRLPTETEWEYACRGGSTSEFFFGDDAGQLCKYAWYKNNSEGKTHSVGQKEPNPWGSYDMHGNVCEWVEDDWHDNYEGAPADGQAWIDKPRDTSRVLRGSSWTDVAHDCRSAARFSHDAPNGRYGGLGFRLARSVALGP